MSPRAPWHLLRSYDPLRRPCWLLDVRTLSLSLQKTVRRVALLRFHFDPEVSALVFEPKGFRSVTRVLERHPSFSEWCTRCWEGDACEHWNLGTLQDEGYREPQSGPARESATRLGLRWPWTEEQVQRAFRVRALQAHPDHGGTAARMHQLILDRALLLERATQTDAQWFEP